MSAAVDSLVKVAVEVALGKRSEVTVYGNDFATPDGTGVQDYIHVSDLARAHVLASNEMFASPGVSHVLNCGYGRGHSVLEVLNTVGQPIGRPIPHVFGPRRPGDSRKRYVAPVPVGLTRLPRRLSSKPSEPGGFALTETHDWHVGDTSERIFVFSVEAS